MKGKTTWNAWVDRTVAVAVAASLGIRWLTIAVAAQNLVLVLHALQELLHASSRDRLLISVIRLVNLGSWRGNRCRGGSIADRSLGCYSSLDRFCSGLNWCCSGLDRLCSSQDWCCSGLDRLCSSQDWCCSGLDRLCSCQDWCCCGDRRLSRCSSVFQLSLRGTRCNRLRSSSVPKAKNFRGSWSCDRLCCSTKAE